jgi:ATP-binding cassette subfamily F protein 3
VVDKIWSIEPDKVKQYSGNYDDYVIAWQRDLEQVQGEAARQEREIQREMEFVQRFRAKATKASQVQSRLKRIEKIKKVVVARTTKKIHFSFPEPPRSGKAVISLKHIEKSYGANVVYADLNLALSRGDKVALVGPNGAGKTTLLKILAGVLPFEKGGREMGHNVITV